MMKMNKVLFFNSLIFGSLIAMSSYSWLSAWMGLEINLLSIIPLLKNHKNIYPSEAALKYFITQTMASSFLLFSIVIIHSFNLNYQNLWMPMSTILCSALLLKLGAAPFHFWFPEVLSGLSWKNSLIMLTWQKLAPLFLLSYQIKNNCLFLSIIVILSSIISGLQGLNQVCFRKILAYSSINHVGWMISSLMNSMIIFLLYFLIYSIINMNIILIFNKFNILFMSQLYSIFSFNKKIKFLFMTNFLSLGGLPPFLGFLPKWLTINNLIFMNHYTLSSMLIIFTLISLYFYLRITFSTFTLHSHDSFIYYTNKVNFVIFLANMFSILSLSACSTMDYIY